MKNYISLAFWWGSVRKVFTWRVHYLWWTDTEGWNKTIGPIGHDYITTNNLVVDAQEQVDNGLSHPQTV